jgi:hypothetical protein
VTTKNDIWLRKAEPHPKWDRDFIQKHPECAEVGKPYALDGIRLHMLNGAILPEEGLWKDARELQQKLVVAPTMAWVSQVHFYRALKLARVFSSEVSMEFGEADLKIGTVSPDLGDVITTLEDRAEWMEKSARFWKVSKVEYGQAGPAMAVRFNCDFLLDALSGMDGNVRVFLMAHKESHAAMLIGKNGNLAVVMGLLGEPKLPKVTVVDAVEALMVKIARGWFAVCQEEVRNG